MTVSVTPQPSRGIRLPEYLQQLMHRFPVPDHEQELTLICKAQEGDRDSLTWLMVASVRLVSKLAKKYEPFVIDTDDLIQEGLLGVHRAVQKFEPSKGFRFSTYARIWALKRIRRFCYMNRLNQLRLPEDKQMYLDRIRRLQTENPGVSLAGIAEKAKLKLDYVEQLLRWSRTFEDKLDWQDIPYFDEVPFDESENLAPSSEEEIDTKTNNPRIDPLHPFSIQIHISGRNKQSPQVKTLQSQVSLKRHKAVCFR